MIVDGMNYLWWPSIVPGGEFVSVLSKDLMNLEPPLNNPG